MEIGNSSLPTDCCGCLLQESTNAQGFRWLCLCLSAQGNYAFGVSHYAGDIKYHAKGFLEKNSDPLPDLIPPACESSHNSLLKMLFRCDDVSV